MDAILSNAQSIAYNMVYSPVMQRLLNTETLPAPASDKLLMLFNSAKISSNSIYDFYFYFSSTDQLTTSVGSRIAVEIIMIYFYIIQE